jgi:hypothetical protein
LVTDLLERLDNDIVTARASGQRVDEINKPSANVSCDKVKPLAVSMASP